MSKEEQVKVEEQSELIEENVEEEKVDKDQNVDAEEKDENSQEDDSKLEESLINEIKSENEKLAKENSRLDSENQTFKDRLARTVAEYDNFRKRTAKEKEGIYTNACEDILKEFLPVLDNLERAITVDGSVEDLKKGIEMTIKQFNGALEKLEVEEIGADGEFDPNVHNAVMHVDDEQYGKNQVVEVFQKGYKRGDKVLRHSMVKVAN
ncbi:heat shock protein GrpE [Clostridium carboxidivorans P7]|uniref:Protein GrpE n=1 Tax=Clostridium carboxidivorans P7 TaxID=536227 RepID=C6PU01_9CLOT|nr:nucleotide exchange factor GrpE [Clostridium carboxidivorans]AKN33641.1 heat shock protein GrpE [Clostridium carboxidivorans P7]EET87300.1 GrpE protein [Clostridium carboxidivorans P7]EFG86764.1 co-chaperone GrpE [Clostridium carboxidivorans P7]